MKTPFVICVLPELLAVPKQPWFFSPYKEAFSGAPWRV
jgi:hypothetical protein